MNGPINVGRFIAVLREEQGVPPPAPSKGPHYWPDIPAYISPLGTGEVTSRSQRREELKRHDCREVEPSEKYAAMRREQELRRERLAPVLPVERRNTFE